MELSLFLGALAFLAVFSTNVPDYTFEDGFRVVSPIDFIKYQQGYCLKENKILSREERYKRGILDYMEKKYKLRMKLSTYSCEENEDCINHDFSNLEYYKSDYINNFNWFEVLKKEQKQHERGWIPSDKSNLDFKMVKLKKEDIVINKNRAGFKKPILSGSDYVRRVYTECSFVLGKDFTFTLLGGIYIDDGLEYDLADEWKKKYEEKFIKRNEKIDNCGNCYNPINYWYEEMKDMYAHPQGG